MIKQFAILERRLDLEVIPHLKYGKDQGGQLRGLWLGQLYDLQDPVQNENCRAPCLIYTHTFKRARAEH